MILVNHKLKVSEKNATDARETSWNLNHINERMIGSQILSGVPWRVPETLSRGTQGQIYLIMLRYYLHFVLSFSPSFPEAAYMWYCNRVNAETVIKIQLSLIKLDSKNIFKMYTAFLTNLCCFGKRLFFHRNLLLCYHS